MSCAIEVYFQKILTIEAVLGRMGCNQTINLVQCDTGPKLNFLLKDCGNAAQPLTGVSGVMLYLSRSDSGCNGGGCQISNEGHEGLSGVNPLNGEWTYVLQPGDVSGAGTYWGELKVIYDDGTCETGFQPLRIYVRESCKACC